MAAKLSDKYHLVIIVDLLDHGANSSNYQLPSTIDSQGEFLNRFLSSMEMPSYHMIALIVSNQSGLGLLIDLAMKKPPFIPWSINIVIAEKLSEKIEY